MNMEIQTANIKSNEAHTFTFSKSVQQFMIGFSKFNLQYKPPDHHVKTIVIDLSDCKKNNNEIVVKPNLVLDDTSKKSKPGDMSITVVIIATVGPGNKNVELVDGLDVNVNNNLPNNNSIVKSALYSTFVQFPNDDHHLAKYTSVIVPYNNGSTYSVNGQTLLGDQHGSTCGQVRGSVLIYSKYDKNILCEDFDSRKLSGTGEICLGNIPPEFRPEEYKVGIFIHGYEVSFESQDHHVLQIEVSAAVQNSALYVRDRMVYANINLKAFLTDNGKNQTNIPRNTITGFIVAFKNRH